ncbi:MAG TPA: SMP-30/gluconolactonase/LRE family protein [Trueperaceae bacterium]
MRGGIVTAVVVLAMAWGLALAQAQPVVTFQDVGLASPESVLYDAQADIYLVSNTNGQPPNDDNGFISKLSPDGKVLDLKWIDGADPGVELNGPKGLTLSGDTLYVADIDTVRMFDLATGEPRGQVKIEGATFLNDMAAGPDGSVYTTDTGVNAQFQPAGTDAIYRITPDGKVETVIKSTDLAAPNGLLVLDSGALFVVSIAPGGLVYKVVDGKQQDVRHLDVERFDGVVALPDGDMLISSWGASSVVRLSPDGQVTTIVEGVQSPADIGLDTKRNRLLVPSSMTNQVLVYQLPAQ